MWRDNCDRLKAKKVGLFDMVLKAGLHARHCPDCSKYLLDIVKEARAIANVDTETKEEVKQ
jgi:hypothetical protein